MQFDDLKRELSQLKGKITDAQDLFRERQFVNARDLLQEILELMEVAHPESHPDFILCLGLLGDCLYELHEYWQAADCFTRSLKIKEAHPEAKLSVLQTSFKLARCLDKAGKVQQAAIVYQDLIDSQKNALDSSQALKDIIFTSYEQCLRRLGKTPGECKKILSKDGKRKSSKMKSGKKPPTQELECQIQGLEAYSRPESGRPSGRLKDSELNPSVNPAVLALKVGVSGLALLAVGGLFFFILKSPNTQAPVSTTTPQATSTFSFSKIAKKLKGKTFVSIDRTASISFDQAGRISFKQGPDTTLLSCIDKGASANLIAHGLMELTLKDKQLTDKNGTRYLEEGTAELLLADKLEAVSRKLETYYQVNSEYPEDEQALKDLVAKELEQAPLQLTYLGRLYADDHSKGYLIPLILPAPYRNDKLEPYKLLTYYALTGDASSGLKCKLFCLRGSLSEGSFLKGKYPATAYLIALQNGRRIIGRDDSNFKPQINEALFEEICLEDRLDPAPKETVAKAVSLEEK
ncbi:MAG: tetratricopeptide repeat protein [Candidatus Obscuribacter sp.]|nr:tetratricopeptide repeat protein [Candidatus Obscuribacter sp.]